MLKNSKARVIINADDLGISVNVNNLIFDLMERRKITSATLMATGPAFDDAVSRIPKYAHCSFGVHLNLTQFAPLSEKKRLSRILDEKGEFAGNRVREVPMDSALREAIYREWRAQIEKMRSAGVTISHIDGHHHTHTIPMLFLALKRIQRDYDIWRIRISRTFTGKDQPFSLRKKLSKAAYNFILRHYRRTITADEFGSFEDYLTFAKTGKFASKNVELMTHPGLKRTNGETTMLDTEWQQSIPYPIQLIDYHKL
jgi:chitin disaccharide deacetylase